MICPGCGEEMTRGKVKWFCEDCGHSVPIAQVAVSTVDDAESLFCTAAFDECYPLLAHEYYVLFEFMKNREYYGAMLEYKDVAEIILKFPTLIAINNLWQKDDHDLSEIYKKSGKLDKSEERTILELLLSKPLSLGDWKTICQQFVSLYKRLTKDEEQAPAADKAFAFAVVMRPLLESVIKFYDTEIKYTDKSGNTVSDNKRGIISWRNNQVGHGALQTGLESNVDFINEFTARLNALKAHFEGSLELYGQSPFILVRNRTTSVFDSLIKDSVFILDYVKGQRYPLDIADAFISKRNLLSVSTLEQGSLKLKSKSFDEVI